MKERNCEEPLVLSVEGGHPIDTSKRLTRYERNVRRLVKQELIMDRKTWNDFCNDSERGQINYVLMLFSFQKMPLLMEYVDYTYVELGGDWNWKGEKTNQKLWNSILMDVIVPLVRRITSKHPN